MDQQENSLNEPPAPKSSSHIFTIVITIMLVAIIATLAVLGVNHYRQKSLAVSPGSSVPVMASITPTGFSPTTIGIASGQTIVWTNYDTKDHIVASNTYPKDNDLPGFKSDVLAQNQTYSFVFDQKGTFSFHDDLNPFIYKGTIIVK